MQSIILPNYLLQFQCLQNKIFNNQKFPKFSQKDRSGIARTDSRLNPFAD